VSARSVPAPQAPTLAPGDWTRLGPTVTPAGVHFAVLAPRATQVDLCLFDPHTGAETPLPLPTRREGVHAGFLPAAGPGLRYGLRAHGPWDPCAGDLFNPAKLLVDPWAPAVAGELVWDDAVLCPPADAPDPRDSAPFMPRSVVADSTFDWQGDRPPRTPWSETFVYETHLKSLTAAHPEVPPALRGTYLGLAHPAAIAHLRHLGITAVELMPIHARVSERRLVQSGLTNYWGYGTLAFLAPDPRFATAPGREVHECKEMVRALHAAGIEVWLDVVYNHTIEGDLRGPHLSLRGLLGADAYRWRGEHLEDWTGCGNTLDLSRPPALRLVMDSLRHWVREYHVDGFRFDLGPALFRDSDGAFDPRGAFASAVAQDPVLAGTKLVSEPWDLGPEGYRLGQHPPPFREWNDRFRDASRRFWRADPGQLPDIASRLGGSSDRFEGRGPLAAINYVACHDGFTLRDLVTYERKRNDANGEQGRDGTDHNLSRAWGDEGPTDDPAVASRRDRVVRSLLATTLLSLGVPMIGHGDELGRTQRGNNNPYCHDSPLTWLDWAGADRELIDFVAHLAAIRRATPALRRDRHLARGEARWLRPDGAPMEIAHWQDDARRALGLHVGGLALLLNGGEDPVVFALPSRDVTILVDTARHALRRAPVPADEVTVEGSALVLVSLPPVDTGTPAGVETQTTADGPGSGDV